MQLAFKSVCSDHRKRFTAQNRSSDCVVFHSKTNQLQIEITLNWSPDKLELQCHKVFYLEIQTIGDTVIANNLLEHLSIGLTLKDRFRSFHDRKIRFEILN